MRAPARHRQAVSYAPGVDLGLAKRVCLVTGGSSGIGLATARELHREGALVAICARDAARLEAARDEIGKGVLAITCDLASAEGPAAAVAATFEHFGRLDVLVNNVGRVQVARWDELSDADWEASWQINVMSYLRAARAALPHLRASDQARIVNVSSTAGKRPSTSMPDYSVTKAAVLSLSRLLADELTKDGILVNAVCPGPTATPIWLAPGGIGDQSAARAGTDRETALAAAGRGRPIGRLAEADEIAAVIVLLASARASYVTGAAWSVDGGTVPIII